MTNIEMVPDFSAQPKIKVIGVGGAGGNAVNRMISDSHELYTNVHYIKEEI